MAELRIGVVGSGIPGLSAARAPLGDRELFPLFLRYPAPTWKVVGGIHLEALRLWRKGQRVEPRPPGPDVPVTYPPSPFETERR